MLFNNELICDKNIMAGPDIKPRTVGENKAKSQLNLKFGRGSGGGWATHFADLQVTLQKQP
jgi:hypothetical protein